MLKYQEQHCILDNSKHTPHFCDNCKHTLSLTKYKIVSILGECRCELRSNHNAAGPTNGPRRCRVPVAAAVVN